MKTKTNGNTEPSNEKLQELVLYIAINSEGDAAFGATKLNKILFFADFIAYTQFGRSITGQEYQKLPYGPAPRMLMPVRHQLEAAGAIVVRPQFRGYQQEKVFALRPPELNYFTAQEIDLVKSLIVEWWGRSASEISESSHQFVGWQAAAEGETIPYEVALVDFREPTAEEEAHCKDLEALVAEYRAGSRRPTAR